MASENDASREEQIESISESRQPEENRHESTPVLRAELQIPQSAIDAYKAQQQTNNRLEQWKFWIEVFTLIVLAIYAGTTYRMWQEMRSGSADTKTLAESAKKQAENTERLANAAIEQVRHLETSVKETQSLAIATQQTLDLARTNFTKEQRPYIWLGLMVDPVFKAGQQASWHFLYVNYGKSPAIKLQTRNQIVFGRDAEKRLDPNVFKRISTPEKEPSGIIVVPGDKPPTYTTVESNEILTEDDVAYIMKTDHGLIAYLYFEYFDREGNMYFT